MDMFLTFSLSDHIAVLNVRNLKIYNNHKKMNNTFWYCQDEWPSKNIIYGVKKERKTQ